MKRLLVVPYYYSDRFRARDLELAFRMVDRYQVYIWRFQWLEDVAGKTFLTRRVHQIQLAFSDVFRPLKTHEGKNGVRLVDAPLLTPALLSPIMGLERAWRLARWFNTRQLGRVAEHFNIHQILLSNTWFDMPRVDSAPVYCYVTDYFNEDQLSPRFLKSEKNWWRELLCRTTANFAVSLPLVRKLEEDYGVRSYYVPNGVDIATIRNVDRDAVASLRRRFGFEGRWVLGYIGNHGPHAGLDFLLAVFRVLRRRAADAALIVVGPHDWWRKRIQIVQDEALRFTGLVPVTEIAPYFHLLDVAVHPCEKSQFRDHSFPLKVLEASAARKFVVSTDLMSLKEANFPNVCMLHREVEIWVDGLLRTRGETWNRDWDAVIEQYDWNVLAEQVAGYMSDRDPA